MRNAGDLGATLGRLEADIEERIFTTGVQACVSLGDEVVMDVVLGDDGLGRLVAPQTLFRVYCSIKPVAAVAVGLLVDEGIVDLDAPLEAMFGSYVALRGGTTLRHVMSHTAGLQRPDGVTIELTPPARRQALIEREPRPDGWVLGRDAAYSEHVAWHVVGRVIEQATGAALKDHLRQAVLEPLGMDDTYIGMESTTYREVLDRIGVNMDMRSLTALPMLFERTERVACETNCAHGGYTTARDLDRFYRAALGALSGDSVPGMPSAKVLSMLCSDARPLAFDSVLQRECLYGLGFMTTLSGHHFGTDVSASAFGHSGNVGASFAFADPAHDLAVSVVFNGIVDHESAYLRRTSLVRSIYADLELGGTAESPVEAPASSEGRFRRMLGGRTRSPKI